MVILLVQCYTQYLIINNIHYSYMQMLYRYIHRCYNIKIFIYVEKYDLHIFKVIKAILKSFLIIFKSKPHITCLCFRILWL